MKLGTPVEFEFKKDIVSGHLYKKGTRRNRAQVIDGSNKIWRVPDNILKERPGTPRNTIVTPIDLLRAKFRVGDLVQFSTNGIISSGRIIKLNPTRAMIALGNGERWRVSYPHLKLDPTLNPSRPGEERLQKFIEQARTLMNSHGLQDWILRLDESYRFLGKCNFRDQVILLSRGHVLDGKDEDIKDTILHEIAHALAGPKAKHGPKWKEIARRIGATPKACFKPEERN